MFFWLKWVLDKEKKNAKKGFDGEIKFVNDNIFWFKLPLGVNFFFW